MLKGKNAVVTGSSRGIGLGIAERFGRAGMNVVMTGIEPYDEVEPKRNAIEKDLRVRALYRQADMTKPEQIRDVIAFGETDLGHIDILVNNAGIQFVAPVDELPDEQWAAIVAINLSSAFHTTKAVLPGMKQRGWGRIINIASVHGLVASPYKSAYVAAKHGVVGMTKAVALEAAETGVTVNAICPGYVWTPLIEQQIPDLAKSRSVTEQEAIDDMLRAVPIGKFVSIDHISELACYLCGDAASSMTGSALSIDGGWAAQ